MQSKVNPDETPNGKASPPRGSPPTSESDTARQLFP